MLVLSLSLGLAPASWAGSSHAAPEGLSPDKAFKELKAGNERYVDDDSNHKRQDEKTRRDLASGQKPHTVVLSCSDSRVLPEILFDQGLGDLYTIRVEGNGLNTSTVASIEYAIKNLGSRLILVMGHESCGAVKAAITTAKGQSAGSADLDSMIASIQPNISGGKTMKNGRSLASSFDMHDTKFRGPAKANVDGVSKQLLKRSKIIRKAVESGKVQVIQGIYGLETGKVDFWGTSKWE